uniref:Synaptic plasticity regulator PANTS n=1 Tax=Astatotilapia calliptera TaxID=8154 RepID=A0AAX7SKJ2_ASTCA
MEGEPVQTVASVSCSWGAALSVVFCCFKFESVWLFSFDVNKPPRACEDYWSEFRHCKSFKNWFHHYYTYGTVPSCQQWKEDYHNCREWEKHRGTEAKEALRRSEKIRVAEQRNFIPVWQLRQEPPRDWHVPLNQEKPQDS